MARLIALSAAVAGLTVWLAPSASAYEYGPVYPTCTAAHEAGVYDIPATDDAYWSDGDRDGDGVACEKTATN